MSDIRTKRLVSGMLLVLGANVSAAAENEHIAACNLETSSEARISCLEDAIRNLSNGTSKVAGNAPEAAAEELLPLETGSQVADTSAIVATGAAIQTDVDVPSSEAPSSVDPVFTKVTPDEQSTPVTASDDVKTDSADEPQINSTEELQTRSAEEPQTMTEAAIPVSAEEAQIATEAAILVSTEKEAASEDLDRLGQEQLDKPDADKLDKRINTHVVSFDFVAIERLRVRLENGQVWRQTDADRPKLSLSLRKLESFDVEMWKTGLGGYRMKILPTGKTVRVRRLQ